MPVYNGARFLREALDSIVTQRFEDFELVISDNASSDETEEICREYLARDKRIRYSRNETNIGLYRNCNRTFRLCSGEYFKLAASDDVCHRDLVARCVEALDDDPTAVLAYPKTIFIGADGKELPFRDPGWDLRSESARERMGYVIRSGHRVNVFFGLMRAQALAIIVCWAN
jgi:glycosyltransferase involved in cell wall biosynthesis